MDVLSRFLSYAAVDTQSSENPAARDGVSSPQPSTEKQWKLARKLMQELKELGAEVQLSEYGYVYAKIRGNADAPKVGFISHMDTSPSASGENVRPRIVRNYDGGEIPLGNGKTLSPSVFPELLRRVGEDLVVTDGTTLLGADDKAGVAEIMTMAEHFLTHPEEAHGELRIAFTPDEEVGRGTEHFDLGRFDADFAFTVDGDELGKIEYENFNAASGTVRIQGVNVHPGSAKGRMVNAALMAMEFNRLLPDCIPANTEKYEGFFHLTKISGDESMCEMHYIIRDHDRAEFEKKKRIFLDAAEQLNRKFEGTDAHADAEVKDSYYNMKEKILPEHRRILDLASEAMRRSGITPFTEPIRGGTDGAMLSWRGLPCPNLPTGGGNYHGVYEYVSIHAMRTMVQVLENIVRLNVRRSRENP